MNQSTSSTGSCDFSGELNAVRRHFHDVMAWRLVRYAKDGRLDGCAALRRRCVHTQESDVMD